MGIENQSIKSLEQGSPMLGPDDLANRMLSEIASPELRCPADVTRPFSDEAVRKTIRLAYGASLLEEEGKSSELTVILGADNPSSIPFDVLISFPGTVPIESAGDLRKLAPALADTGCALWVAQTCIDGKSQLRGFGILDSESFRKTFMTSMPRGASPNAFMYLNNSAYMRLRVDGPGNLKVALIPVFAQWGLRAGEICRASPLFAPSPRAFQRYISARVLADEQVQAEIFATWANVLQMCQIQRRGGTFLIVPSDDATPDSIRTDYQLESKFTAGADLLSAAVVYIEKVRRVFSVQQEERVPDLAGLSLRLQASTAYEECGRALRKLQLTEIALARISSVDGCVVLDRSQRVHLFGAKIRKREGAAPLPVKEIDPKTDTRVELEKLGTRNKSAFEFCQYHPGSLAFVISQDSDLRLYWSDNDYVYANFSAEPRLSAF